MRACVPDMEPNTDSANRHRADPGKRRSERVEENVGADAIELSAGQLNRLNDVEPPVGDRYADMTPINR